MEIYANELSVLPNTFDKYENIRNLSQIYQGLRKSGFSSCRISGEALFQITTSLSAVPQKRDLLNFVYSFFHAPFDTDEIVEYCAEEYASHQWSYEGEDCVGLAYARIMDSLAVSFDEEKWGSSVFINRDLERVETRNVSNAEHISEHSVWIDSLKQIVLIETDVPYEKKKIHFRDDHGTDVLLDFSKRICKSPYVIGVINSLRFNPNSKDFIRKVKPDGVIECVLRWTDAGYGIAIKTTGRDLRETEMIGKILEHEYCE